MAWPLSRILTFVPNATVITAAFLNQVQDTVTDLFNGTITLKSLALDGVGGAVVTAVAGALTLSATFAGQTEPTTVIPAGQLSADLVPRGLVTFDGLTMALGNPGLISGVNVKSVTRTGVDGGGNMVYVIVFSFVPPATNARRTAVVFTPDSGLAPAAFFVERGLEAVTNNLKVTLRIAGGIDAYGSVAAWAI